MSFKSAHVYPTSAKGLEVKILDVQKPTLDPNQVLIRVVVSGTNPKDWKYPLLFGGAAGLNTGDDIAGYVDAIGSNVTEFHVGDRVAAFHEMLKPYGSFAEYAVAWEKTTFHLPKETS